MSGHIGDVLRQLRQYQSLASVYYQLASAHAEACWMTAVVTRDLDKARYHCDESNESAYLSNKYAILASDLHTSHYNGSSPQLTRDDHWSEHDAIKSLRRTQDFARRADRSRLDAAQTVASVSDAAEQGGEP